MMMDNQDAPLVLRVLEKALTLQAPMSRGHIERLRRNHPEESPNEILRRLNRELRAATVSAGAGVGALAAAPAVGTGAALALSGVESFAFLNASVLYVLARAEVSGLPVHDIERRRTLVMAILLGDAGAAQVGAVAERTGKHWATRIIKEIPYEKILRINKVLGKNFVTKSGTKQGILVLGKVIPFGIGAVIGGSANAVLSHGVIKAADRAFGTPGSLWPSPAPDAQPPPSSERPTLDSGGETDLPRRA